jgi:hypothetical protein
VSKHQFFFENLSTQLCRFSLLPGAYTPSNPLVMSSEAKSDGHEKAMFTFHGANVLQSDVDLLNGPHWVNDNNISFELEYMQYVHSYY